jgi:enoyl-CoA hydratase/carnithine racemase
VSLLSIERRGAVALVTLQRPEKRNALSIELRVELADAFGRLSEDEEIGCVALTGAGPAFCAGMDVTQFGGDREHKRRLVETSTIAFEAVGRCSRPVLAAVNGPAVAGGFALALLCDLRIASSRASFGFPELPRGIPPSYAAARAALPAAVPMADAVFNVAHASLLVLGLVRGDWDLVARGLDDRLHQPHREHLYPRSLALARRARELGALGATISGAGPTLLVWCTFEATGAVLGRLRSECEGWADVIHLPFEPNGAEVVAL